MNLYLSLGHIWTGTQADARAAQGGKDFQSIDVPTDKAGLLAFLNGMTQAAFLAAVEAPPVTRTAFQTLYRNGDPTTINNGSRDPGARA